MKRAVRNFLLSRGVSTLQQVLSKLFRHGVTALGGVGIAAGHMTDSDLISLQGAAAVIVSVLVSVTRALVVEKLAE